MRIRLVQLHLPSKDFATFYTLYYGSDSITLFEKFNNKYIKKYKKEIDVIKMQLKSMGQITGAKGSYFDSAEINQGDKVFSFNIHPKHRLRIYCIKFSEKLVVFGGGGLIVSGKGSVAADQILLKENALMGEVSRLIDEKLNLGEIYIHSKGMRFLGNLDLDNNVKP